jgi:hypothetical protein
MITVAVTKLHASRPRKDFTSPYRTAISQEHGVANFVTLGVVSCLLSPGLAVRVTLNDFAVILKHAIW